MMEAMSIRVIPTMMINQKESNYQLVKSKQGKKKPKHKLLVDLVRLSQKSLKLKDRQTKV